MRHGILVSQNQNFDQKGKIHTKPDRQQKCSIACCGLLLGLRKTERLTIGSKGIIVEVQ